MPDAAKTKSSAPDNGRVIDAPLTEEVQKSYVDYAMSVIVARALPDARDGLKPVHRRILHAMRENGYDWNKPFRKSAGVVGDVMGKYHPHGDSAIYDAMVRLAQDFSMRVLLVDGQGNFGSMDGDRAAAMRYTEARLAKIAGALLDDIDKDTVDFQPNYDGSREEPKVLPARFPNLLVNGSEGIAVGMSTKIPPHNPEEIIDATIALVDDSSATTERLMQCVKGPDFPTGGVIAGKAGILQAYSTGKGSIVVQAKHEIEEIRKGRFALVFTEMPYQVNKAATAEKIGALVREKTIDGISEMRDESDRDGVRLVVEIKQGFEPEIVLAQLRKHTDLQTSFPINLLALDNGRPQQITLKRALEAFIEFRRQVIRRRSSHLLRKARERAHVAAGLLVAIANIDAVIRIIRSAKDQAGARAALTSVDFDAKTIMGAIAALEERDPKAPKRRLDDIQARALLELRLHKLTGLEIDALEAEAKSLAADIKLHMDILSDPARLTQTMRDELVQIRQELASPRRTVIEDAAGVDVAMEDLIQREDMVVTFTHGGYVKRAALSGYRNQKRGGKGKNGMETKEDDFVTQVLSATTHTPILFFTDRGMCFKLKVWQLPEGGATGRGRPLVNLIPLQPGEKIAATLALPEDEAEQQKLAAAFVTASGHCRRNSLADFLRVPTNGKIAMKLVGEDGKPFDTLVGVLLAEKGQDILIMSKRGMAVRFPAEDVRIFTGRESLGNRAINLADDDAVVSAAVLNHVDFTPAEAERLLSTGVPKAPQDDEAGEDAAAAAAVAPERVAELKAREQMVLTVTTRGFGKRTSAYAYRVTQRGAKGLNDGSGSPKVGEMVGAFVVEPGAPMMLVTDKGQIIRIGLDDVRIARRRAAGVRLFQLEKDETVVAAAQTPGGADSEEPV